MTTVPASRDASGGGRSRNSGGGGRAAPLRLTAMYDVRIGGFSLLKMLPCLAVCLALLHITSAVIALVDNYDNKVCWVDQTFPGALIALVIVQFASVAGLGFLLFGSYMHMRRVTTWAITITTLLGLSLFLLHGLVGTAVAIYHNKTNEDPNHGESCSDKKGEDKFLAYLLPEIVFFSFDFCVYPVFVFIACETTKAYGYHPEYEAEEEGQVTEEAPPAPPEKKAATSGKAPMSAAKRPAAEKSTLAGKTSSSPAPAAAAADDDKEDTERRKEPIYSFKRVIIT